MIQRRFVNDVRSQQYNVWKCGAFCFCILEILVKQEEWDHFVSLFLSLLSIFNAGIHYWMKRLCALQVIFPVKIVARDEMLDFFWRYQMWVEPCVRKLNLRVIFFCRIAMFCVFPFIGSAVNTNSVKPGNCWCNQVSSSRVLKEIFCEQEMHLRLNLECVELLIDSRFGFYKSSDCGYEGDPCSSSAGFVTILNPISLFSCDVHFWRC